MPRKTSRRTRRVICAIVCIVAVFICMWTQTETVPVAPQVNPTHYEILNTTVNASNAELKRAYHMKARVYHPDKWQRLGTREQAKAERRYTRVRNSYAVLSSRQRCYYDRHILNATSLQYVGCLKRMAEQGRAEFKSASASASASAKKGRQSKRFKNEREQHRTTPTPQYRQQGETPEDIPSALILFKSTSTYYLKQLADQIKGIAHYVSDLTLAVLIALLDDRPVRQ